MELQAHKRPLNRAGAVASARDPCSRKCAATKRCADTPRLRPPPRSPRARPETVKTARPLWCSAARSPPALQTVPAPRFRRGYRLAHEAPPAHRSVFIARPEIKTEAVTGGKEIRARGVAVFGIHGATPARAGQTAICSSDGLRRILREPACTRRVTLPVSTFYFYVGTICNDRSRETV